MSRAEVRRCVWMSRWCVKLEKHRARKKELGVVCGKETDTKTERELAAMRNPKANRE